MSNREWTAKWPTTPGCYWAHGYFHDAKKTGRPKELLLVRVLQVSNGVLWAGEGNFLSRDECADVLFTPAELPEEPKR